jgi:hypothetical protein
MRLVRYSGELFFFPFLVYLLVSGSDVYDCGVIDAVGRVVSVCVMYVLSDSECDSENDLYDCAVLDIVVDGDSDQDDIIQDFVWEDMNNYKGQRETSPTVLDLKVLRN